VRHKEGLPLCCCSSLTALTTLQFRRLLETNNSQLKVISLRLQLPIMRNSTSLVVIMAILTAFASAGTFFIDNYCPFPMYLQSTSTPADGPVPLVRLPTNTSNAYLEIMRDAGYSINALTLSRTPDMAAPMQATYHQTTFGPAPGDNFYALSTIFGDPLMAEGFQLLTAPYRFGPNCPPRSAGQDCPYTYSPGNPDGDDAVYFGNDLNDLRLTLCKFNQNATADSA
jgi:hypothetical protein